MSKVIVIYWSSTGNTEKMAKATLEGVSVNSDDLTLIEVDNAKSINIQEYSHIALGCSAMGAEVLSDEMEEYFKSIKDKISDKKIMLFGSYDWGDGQWMRDWEEEVKETGSVLFNDKGYITQNEPQEDDINILKEAGKEFAKF